MEVEILKEEKDRLQFKLKDETHTLLNLLSKELFNDKNVEFAGYRVEHPLVNEAIVSVTAKNPRKAIKDAIKRIQKQVDDFQAQVKKLK
jgi:DNA-directed RNA polymerase subunit L